MLDLSAVKKNKIHLSDYPCDQDIENRMLMADFSTFDVELLEEILYSPLKVSIKKLKRSLSCSEEELLFALQKFSRAHLLSIEGDSLLIDKERRKYFEFEIVRFDPDFKPDLEFAQGLLHKVPIHVLPIWYAIPRTSNHIFGSIIEKYLLTPQIYHRYLIDLHFANPLVHPIIQEVFSAPDFKISSTDLISKFNLMRQEFEEILLLLEFHFICCVTYKKEEDHWIEFVTPFYEWREYLRFLKKTEAPAIDPASVALRQRDCDFAFIEDMTHLLTFFKKKGILFDSASLEEFAKLSQIPSKEGYLSHLVEKALLLQLAEKKDKRLHLLESAREWFDMTLENRALWIYRHPLNRITSVAFSPQIAAEKNIREAEKAIKRALHGNWVLFEEFIEGVVIPLKEEATVVLKKVGKHWHYALPSHTEEERLLIRAAIFEWLFEVGMVKIGSCGGKECFAVTSFGRFFFED